MMMTPAVLLPLTKRQQEVLAVITQFYAATGEPCSARWLARRLGIHHSSIQSHLVALHRKGWIPAPASPRPRY